MACRRVLSLTNTHQAFVSASYGLGSLFLFFEFLVTVLADDDREEEEGRLPTSFADLCDIWN